ncbi:MAG: OmpA family protein [Pyrinomonadaceae bacterium]
MPKLLVIFIGILAFALLCYLCINRHVPEILGAATVPAANKNVNANVTLGTPTFKAESKDGKVVLTGVLPDQATKDQLLAKAREVYGADNIFDNLTVDPKVAKPAWLAAVMALMPFSAKDVKNGGITVEKNSISLIGQVPSDTIKAKVFSDASIALPNATINNLLTVGQGTVTADQAATQAEINEQIGSKVVEFDTASDQLTSNGKAVLDGIVPIMQQHAAANFEIAGNTDSKGNPAANQKLSERRAATVKNYLVSKGLAADRFTTKGFGGTQPVASNETEEGRQKNRRIGFSVTGGGK